MVQGDQRGRRPAPGIGQGGGQPVADGGAAGVGGDGDLGVDDTDGDSTHDRQPGAVVQATQHGQLAIGLTASQQVGVGGGDATGEGGGGEVAVAQHQHPGMQAPDELAGHGRLSAADGTEGHIDQAAGAAGDQAQQGIARATMVAGLGGVDAMVGGGVGDAEGGPRRSGWPP